MLGTKLCDRCWELESRITADPGLALSIIAGLRRSTTKQEITCDNELEQVKLKTSTGQAFAVSFVGSGGIQVSTLGMRGLLVRPKAGNVVEIREELP